MDPIRLITEEHGADIGAAALALDERDQEMLTQMLFLAAVERGEERNSRIGMVAMALQVIQRDAADLALAARDTRRTDLLAQRQARCAALEALREAIRLRYAVGRA